MQTIKTAVVVVMLLAVLYGAYVALNGTETPLPVELENMAELNVDFGGPPSLPDISSNSQQSGFFVQSPGPSTPTSNFPPPPSPFPNPPSNVIDTGKPFEPLAPNSLPAPNLMGSGSLGSSQVIGSNEKLSALPSTNLPPFAPPTIPESGNSNALPPINGTVVSTKSQDAPLGNELKPQLLAGSNGDQGGSILSSGSQPSLGTLPNPPSLSIPSGADTSVTSEEKKGLPNATSSKSFHNAKSMALEQASRGELKEALATLSLFYNAPELTQEQHQELLELLDPLAGEVIYSRRHLLDIPFVVGQGETLEQIAKQFEVPSEILGKVNAIDNPNAIAAGTKLKVIPGPFRAEVDLNRSELTLFLGELYAGRFAIEIGKDPQPKEGVYQVVEKQKNRNYYGKAGTIDGADPRNPYGGCWIDLGQEICIHGTPSQPIPAMKEIGCISLSPIDATDVFGMLSRGSKVQIRR